MTSEEIVALVDRCVDGQINTTELERLEDALRRSPEHATRIAEELELAGLIAEALDRTAPADFLRGFRERLEAERTGRSFSRDTIRRALAEDRQQRAPARGPRMGRAESAVEAPVTARKAPVRRRGKGGVKLAVPSVRWIIPLGLIAVLLLLVPFRLGAALEVEAASPGVRVNTATSVAEVEVGDRLRPGDRLDVPIGGGVSFKYRDGTRFDLNHGALIVEPGTVPVFGEQTPRRRRFLLERGGLHVRFRKPKPCIVYTPHCKTEAEEGSIAISVTRNSTRVRAGAHPLVLTLSQGGHVHELAPGEERVVTAN